MADAAAEPVQVDPAKLRNLKIKTGVVKRYTKEKVSYEKEVEQQKGKIEVFKSEGKEEHFIKQQVNCLKESQVMISEVQRKLATSFEELKELATAEEELAELEEYKVALQVLEDAKPHLPTN